MIASDYVILAILTDAYFNRFLKYSNIVVVLIHLIIDLMISFKCSSKLVILLAVEVKPCEFHLVWRSLYACPICLENKLYELHTDCVNGKKNITYEAGYNCRNRTGSNNPRHRYFVPCSVCTHLVTMVLSDLLFSYKVKPKLQEQFSMTIFYLLVQMGPYDNFLSARANGTI